MSVKISHAVGDEKGEGRGGKAGDQTGREVRVQNWYLRDGGWGVYIECTDKVLAAKAALNATLIANDDSFGYDKDQRTTAYKAILAAGSIEAAADSELDCSVLAFISYKLAGLNIEIGYTGNLESRFLATGKFVAHRESKYLTSPEYAKIGGLYLTAGAHVAIIVSDGSKVDSSTTRSVLVLGSVNVRATAGVPTPDMTEDEKWSHRSLFVAKKNQKYEFLGTDSSTGWHRISTQYGVGYISNKSNLTKIV